MSRIRPTEQHDGFLSRVFHFRRRPRPAPVPPVRPAQPGETAEQYADDVTREEFGMDAAEFAALKQEAAQDQARKDQEEAARRAQEATRVATEDQRLLEAQARAAGMTPQQFAAQQQQEAQQEAARRAAEFARIDAEADRRDAQQQQEAQQEAARRAAEFARIDAEADRGQAARDQRRLDLEALEQTVLQRQQAERAAMTPEQLAEAQQREERKKFSASYQIEEEARELDGLTLDQQLQRLQEREALRELAEVRRIEAEAANTEAAKQAAANEGGTNNLIRQATAALADYAKRDDKDLARVKALSEKLKQAQAERNAGNYRGAGDLCREVIQEARYASPAAAQDDLSANARRKIESDTARIIAQRQQDADVITVGEAFGRDVELLMRQHEAAVPAEKAVFKDIRWFDDLLLLKTPAERVQKVKAISAAVSAARDRQESMTALLTALQGRVGPDQQEQLQLGRKFQANMTAHIPDAFLLEPNLETRAANMERVLTMGDQERKDAINALLTGDQAAKDQEKRAYEEAINYGSLKPAELTAFYFDEPVRPITLEQQNALMAATDAAIRRAQQIKDLGGSVAEVEKSLEHLPPEFWPPQFIAALQAWRKVEREMIEERASKRAKQLTEGPEKLGALNKLDILNGAAGIADIIGNLANIIGAVSDTDQLISQQEKLDELISSGMTPEQAAASPEYTAIQGPLNSEEALYMRMVAEESREITKLIAPIAGYLKTGNIDGLKHLARSDPKTREDILTIVGKVDSVLSKFKYVEALSNTAGLAQAFPILGAASTGLDLLKACYQLKHCVEATVTAGRLLDKAEADFFGGTAEDEAFLNAVINEKDAQKLRTVKKSVEVAGRTISTLGDVAKLVPEPHTHMSGYVIKAVGKTIEVAHKVVFAGIDWGKAKEAMATLKEAQAGNPQARVEIFENCALYAKHYLAIAARDGHPIAKKLLVDRGVTEGDLTKALALQILRDTLMKKAEQRNEVESNDFGTILSDGLFTEAGTRLLKAGGHSIASGARKAARAVRGDAKPYVPGAWAPPAPDLTPAVWEQAKKGAIANGLEDAKTGIGEGLTALAAPLQAALAAVTDNAAAMPDRRDRIVQGVKALETVRNAIYQYQPLSNDGKPYTEMTTFLHGVAGLVGGHLAALNQALIDIGAKNPNWQPTGGTGVEAWQRSWQSGTAAWMLPADDFGVANCMAAFEQAQQEANTLETQAPGRSRAARMRARDELKKLAGALNKCHAAAAESDALRAYIDKWLSSTIAASQVLERELKTATVQGVPAEAMGANRMDPGSWRQLYDAATQQALLDASAGDQGLAKALNAADQARRQLEAAQAAGADGKVLAAARAKIIEANTNIARAAAKLTRANPEAPAQLGEHLQAITNEAKNANAAARLATADIKFNFFVGLTDAGWKRTYQQAVASGAVPADGGMADDLTNALTTFVEAQREFNTAKDPATKLLAAQRIDRKLKRIDEALRRLENTIGYDHPQMLEYARGMRAAMDRVKNDPARKQVLSGQAVTASIPVGPFNWKVSDWDKVKTAAIKAGILPADYSGLGLLIKKVGRSMEQATKETDPDKKDMALQKGLKRLDMLEAKAKALKDKCKHPDMQTFLNDVIAKVGQRRANPLG